MTKMEKQLFKKTLRRGRQPFKVYLQNDKTPTSVWSNYSLSRDILHPNQKMPKVGHWSDPRGARA